MADLDFVCDLFDRWAELEPNRCKPYATEDMQGEHRKPVDTGRAVYLDYTGWWNVNPKNLLLSGKPVFRDLEEHDIAVLQRAVQQAIQVQGWQLSLDWDLLHWVAYLSTHAEAELIDGGVQTDAAIALLAAYVQALTIKAGGGNG